MRNRNCQLFILLLLLLVQCTSKKHNYAAEIPDPMKEGGYVSNPDHIISENTTAALNDLLGKLDQAGKAQVAVVLLKSIGNQVIEDVSHDIFTTWKPGNKETNNGLVVLLVKDQHKIRFETGYGLEGDLPDVICFRIQQTVMLPYFKQDNYDEGMEKGLQAVAGILTNPEGGVSVADNGDGLSDTAIDAADAGVNALVGNGGVKAAGKNGGAKAVGTNGGGKAAGAGVGAKTAGTDGGGKAKGADAGAKTAGTDGSVKAIDIDENSNDAFWDADTAGASASYGAVAIDSAGEDLQSDPNYLVQDNDISRPGVGTIFFYFFYIIFSFITFGVLKGDKHKGDLYRTTWLARSFVLLVPGIIMLVLCFALNIPYSIWITIGLCYLTWTIYLSYRYTLINAREKKLEFTDRHTRYEALNIAHKNLLFTAFVFPLPFLAYYRWHDQRMKKLRYEPYDCDTCSQPMTLLNRNKKKAFMNDIQAAEEKVGSVIYDVWHCKNCDTHKTIGYDSIYTKVKTCPKCNNKTFEQTRTQTVKRATEYSAGEGIQFSECRYCNFVEKKTFVIPRKSSSSSSSSSSGSSSSSSGGSWGGGSSGGGGSSSSW